MDIFPGGNIPFFKSLVLFTFSFDNSIVVIVSFLRDEDLRGTKSWEGDAAVFESITFSTSTFPTFLTLCVSFFLLPFGSVVVVVVSVNGEVLNISRASLILDFLRTRFDDCDFGVVRVDSVIPGGDLIDMPGGGAILGGGGDILGGGSDIPGGGGTTKGGDTSSSSSSDDRDVILGVEAKTDCEFIVDFVLFSFAFTAVGIISFAGSDSLSSVLDD